jgi:hypothetical protein
MSRFNVRPEVRAAITNRCRALPRAQTHRKAAQFPRSISRRVINNLPKAVLRRVPSLASQAQPRRAPAMTKVQARAAAATATVENFSRLKKAGSMPS